MDYQFPLIVTHRDGQTRIFNDADGFRAFAFNRANGGVGGYWLEGRRNYGSERLFRIYEEENLKLWYRTSSKNTWIVRDNRGRVVDVQDFVLVVKHPPYRWNAERQQAAEAGLPIPGTGKRRRHSSRKWTKNGRNGAHNQRKGIKLYEDPKIRIGDLDDL